MDNLNTILKFIKNNNNYSDYNLVENYLNSLNFDKFRGGSNNFDNDTDFNNKNINNNKYTIKEGTLLFHASENKKINNKIKIGEVKLYAYFTNNLDIVSNTLKLLNSNEKFIHVFKTKKNIDNLIFDITNYNENNLHPINQVGGICFKYPIENRIERFKNNLNIQNNLPISDSKHNNSNIELALFDLKDNLEYLYSFSCEKIN